MRRGVLLVASDDRFVAGTGSQLKGGSGAYSMKGSDLLDAAQSRPFEGGASFSLSNRMTRASFRLAWFLLASWTPPFLHKWRRWILVCFGAQLGSNVDVRGSAIIWLPRNLVMEDNSIIAEGVRCYNQARVTIETWVIVSQRAFLCTGTHDINDPNFQLVTKPIVINSGAWIAAEAFVGPGVIIGARAVLGARAATFQDLEEGGVYIGNPAIKIKQRAAVAYSSENK
jgi:putative colanic acid biosynthesis acetyltransferase WcaF